VSHSELFFWVILPYASITVFVVGHIWRYRRDQYSWSARSTQLFESRALMVGSNLFHIGALLAIGGHVLGILIPWQWTEAIGISDDAYHVIAGVGGVLAGATVTAGFVILLWRRLRYPRVRATTRRVDVWVFFLLAVTIFTGMWATLSANWLGDHVGYRYTVAPWFRELFILRPDGTLMSSLPFMFQFHVTIAWFLFATWPFSRLVHAWSIPLGYFRRSPVLYRSRTGVRPGEAGAPAAR
jgi:nitrate reductase gamma subunit